MFACSDSPHSEPGTIDEVDHDNGTEPHTSDEGEWGGGLGQKTHRDLSRLLKPITEAVPTAPLLQVVQWSFSMERDSEKS